MSHYNQHLLLKIIQNRIKEIEKEIRSIDTPYSKDWELQQQHQLLYEILQEYHKNKEWEISAPKHKPKINTTNPTKKPETIHEIATVYYMVDKFAELNINELNDRINNYQEVMREEHTPIFKLPKKDICKFFVYSGELQAYTFLRKMLKDIENYKEYIITEE